MSTHAARLRKYGKKSQATNTISRIFLDVSSPEKPSRRKSVAVLKETSGNSQSPASKSSVRGSKLKKSSNLSEDAQAPEPEETPATGTAGSHTRKLEALVDQVASLRLETEPPLATSTSETKPSHPVELRSHPATINKETEAYLEPLAQCKNVSKTVESFQGWMDERESLLVIKKIGEGSFGEVYRAECVGKEAVILKLMPLNAQKGKGARSFTSIKAARNEVRLLSRMSKVPGFVEFRGACILQGCMPTQLIEEWDTYRESGRTVESRNPHKKEAYPVSQLWILIEMSDAGHSLEPGRYAPPGYKSVRPAESPAYLPVRYTWDIFWQIVKILAKGEVFASYEHRDLHLGNICVKGLDTPVALSSDDHDVYGINRAGVEVTLIDYSLSRASVSPEETLCYDFKNDKALLKGQGDLQYDMYRHMAAVVGKQTSNAFVPQTNVLWLWYVLKRLLAVTHDPSAEINSEHNDEESVGLYANLVELRSVLDPAKRVDWPWLSAGHLLEEGMERNWFLAREITDM